ncbi:hypothetical protein Tco_1157090 [Tanacetum coccineum]
MGEGLANPTDPYHTPTIIQPLTSQPQKKQKPRRPKRKDTEIPQSSGPTGNVADEAVNEEMDDSLERAATTATSLDAEQDRGNIDKTQSKEDASKQGRKIDDIDKDVEITLIDETQGKYGDDIMFDKCVLDDEEVFAGKDMDEKEINVAKKEVSTVDPVTTAGEVVTTTSPIENTTADDLTLAQTLIEIRSAKSKVKGVKSRVNLQQEQDLNNYHQKIKVKVSWKSLRNQQRKKIKLDMMRKLLKDFKLKCKLN